MIRLMLIILFFPAIMWFYGTIFAVGLLFLLFAIQFIETYKGEIFSFLLVIGVIYWLIQINIVGKLKIRYKARRKQQEIKQVWSEVVPMPNDEKFTSSSDLYCYWCSRKLGVKGWERAGKYYCDDCYSKITNDISS